MGVHLSETLSQDSERLYNTFLSHIEPLMQVWGIAFLPPSYRDPNRLLESELDLFYILHDFPYPAIVQKVGQLSQTEGKDRLLTFIQYGLAHWGTTFESLFIQSLDEDIESLLPGFPYVSRPIYRFLFTIAKNRQRR